MAGFTTEPAYEDAYERIDSAQRFARWFGLDPEYLVTTEGVIEITTPTSRVNAVVDEHSDPAG